MRRARAHPRRRRRRTDRVEPGRTVGAAAPPQRQERPRIEHESDGCRPDRQRIEAPRVPDHAGIMPCAARIPYGSYEPGARSRVWTRRPLEDLVREPELLEAVEDGRLDADGRGQLAVVVGGVPALERQKRGERHAGRAATRPRDRGARARVRGGRGTGASRLRQRRRTGSSGSCAVERCFPRGRRASGCQSNSPAAQVSGSSSKGWKTLTVRFRRLRPRDGVGSQQDVPVESPDVTEPCLENGVGVAAVAERVCRRRWRQSERFGDLRDVEHRRDRAAGRRARG